MSRSLGTRHCLGSRIGVACAAKVEVATDLCLLHNGQLVSRSPLGNRRLDFGGASISADELANIIGMCTPTGEQAVLRELCLRGGVLGAGASFTDVEFMGHCVFDGSVFLGDAMFSRAASQTLSVLLAVSSGEICTSITPPFRGGATSLVRSFSGPRLRPT